MMRRRAGLLADVFLLNNRINILFKPKRNFQELNIMGTNISDRWAIRLANFVIGRRWFVIAGTLPTQDIRTIPDELNQGERSRV